MRRHSRESIVNRRRFLALLSYAAGAMSATLAPLGIFRTSHADDGSPPPAVNGFLVLEPGARAPAAGGRTDRVAPPWESLDGRARSRPSGISFESPGHAARATRLLLYDVALATPNTRRAPTEVITDTRGKIFQVAFAYETYDEAHDRWRPVVAIVAQPGYAGPPPVWMGGSHRESLIPLTPEPATPQPGISIRTLSGGVAHWLVNDVRYTLEARDTDELEFEQLLRSLRPV